MRHPNMLKLSINNVESGEDTSGGHGTNPDPSVNVSLAFLCDFNSSVPALGCCFHSRGHTMVYLCLPVVTVINLIVQRVILDFLASSKV